VSKLSSQGSPSCRAPWEGCAPNCGLISASFPFKDYVIFFRYVDDEILEIVHIIEGHRDIAAIFADDDAV